MPAERTRTRASATAPRKQTRLWEAWWPNLRVRAVEKQEEHRRLRTIAMNRKYFHIRAQDGA